MATSPTATPTASHTITSRIPFFHLRSTPHSAMSSTLTLHEGATPTIIGANAAEEERRSSHASSTTLEVLAALTKSYKDDKPPRSQEETDVEKGYPPSPTSPHTTKKDWNLDAKDQETSANYTLDSPDNDDITTAEGLAAAYGQPPDGGKEAWLVVLGGCAAATSAYGMLASYGAFNTYYATYLIPQYSVSTVSWIGSLAGFITLGLGVFGGSFFDRHGARKLLIIGTVIQVFALMMISLCTEFYQLMLAHGVLLPVGTSLLMVVPIAVVNQWFSKRKGLAIGIVMSFSSWGSICWPLIISSLPSRIGWGWTVRLIGFIQLLLLSLAIWLLKTRLPPKPSGPIIYLKALSFRRPAYLLLCISCMSFTFSFFFFLFYIGSYAQQYGYGTKGNYFLLIMNGCSGIGRIGSGFLADRIGRFNVSTAGLIIAALVMFLWQLSRTYASMAIIAALYGLSTGGNIGLQAVCVAQVTDDPRLIGTMIGQIISAQAIPALIGPPLSGLVLGQAAATQFARFPYAIALNGSVMAIAGLTIGGARLTLSRKLLAKV